MPANILFVCNEGVGDAAEAAKDDQRRVAVLLVLAGDQKPHQLVDLAEGATSDPQLEEEDIDAEGY